MPETMTTMFKDKIMPETITAINKNEIFYVHGSVHHESISVIVKQDATLYSFYSLQIAVHDSGDTFTHHQERE
jgi:hypothetical protein